MQPDKDWEFDSTLVAGSLPRRRQQQQNMCFEIKKLVYRYSYCLFDQPILLKILSAFILCVSSESSLGETPNDKASSSE